MQKRIIVDILASGSEQWKMIFKNYHKQQQLKEYESLTFPIYLAAEKYKNFNAFSPLSLSLIPPLSLPLSPHPGVPVCVCTSKRNGNKDCLY